MNFPEPIAIFGLVLTLPAAGTNISNYYTIQSIVPILAEDNVKETALDETVVDETVPVEIVPDETNNDPWITGHCQIARVLQEKTRSSSLPDHNHARNALSRGPFHYNNAWMGAWKLDGMIGFTLVLCQVEAVVAKAKNELEALDADG